MNELAIYGSLALAAFLAATLLPGGAEVAMLAALEAGSLPFFVIVTASIFNALGSWVTYEMGFFGKLSWASKYLRIKEESLRKFQGKVEKFGSYAGFFCFLPFVGDPLALAIGYFKASRFIFLVSMSAGKLLRFVVIWYGWSQLNGG